MLRKNWHVPRSSMLLPLLIILAACACQSASEPTGGVNYSVTYRAWVELNNVPGAVASLESVVFLDGEGNEVTIQTPQNVWQLEISMFSGDSYYLRAEGTVTNARVRAGASILGTDASDLSVSDEMPGFDPGPGASVTAVVATGSLP